MGALGVLPPDIEPRATEHIGEMVAMITSAAKRDSRDQWNQEVGKISRICGVLWIREVSRGPVGYTPTIPIPPTFTGPHQGNQGDGP